MSVQFDFSDSVVLVTGVGGALGSAVAEAFLDADATVCGVDVVAADDEGFLLEAPERIDFYRADFTDESAVVDTVESVVDRHGEIDYLANVAGTWRGGDPVHETDVDLFDLLFDVNLKTAFLGAKHAIPHIRKQEGAIVSVASRSSLSGGEEARLAIAGALAMEPQFLVLDEPLAGLDAASRRSVLDRLEDLSGAGTGLVVVTHDVRDLADAADRVVGLSDGSVALDAAPGVALDRLEGVGVRDPRC